MKVSATTLHSNPDSRRKVMLHKMPANAYDNLKKITTDFGILQHDKINRLHSKSFHSLSDNALALISSCRQFQLDLDENYFPFVKRYLDFIELCQQSDGLFQHVRDTKASKVENHFEAQGYTVWALGYMLAMKPLLPQDLGARAEIILQKAMWQIENVQTPRAIALMIKGLYYYNTLSNSNAVSSLIKTLADRLAQRFLEESTKEWQWFASSITLGDSVLPEALLCAYLDTDEYIYKDIAKSSFDFLLLKAFSEFPAISNKARIKATRKTADVVNIILALSKFFGYFKENFYLSKINTAYSKFATQSNYNSIRVA